MRQLTTRRQAGDTIVEVLIAMAVVALVLAGAYVTANRSLNNIREAQERTEAIKYVEEQLERLKVAGAGGSSAPIFTNARRFCIIYSGGTNTVTSATTLPTDNVGTIPPTASDNLSSYTGNCTKGSVNYRISITRTTTVVAGFTTYNFNVYARWDRPGGGETDQVVMAYKVDQ